MEEEEIGSADIDATAGDERIDGEPTTGGPMPSGNITFPIIGRSFQGEKETEEKQAKRKLALEKTDRIFEDMTEETRTIQDLLTLVGDSEDERIEILCDRIERSVGKIEICRNKIKNVLAKEL